MDCYDSVPRSPEIAQVLVVDDDLLNREVIEAQLQLAHYRVILANTGQLALEVAAACQPDVILLDVRLHGMDGYEVCRRLKQSDQTRSIPVIIMTAIDDAQERGKAQAVGANAFIARPFLTEALLKHVRLLLDTTN